MTRIRATSVLSGIGWIAALVACSSGQGGLSDGFGSESSEAGDSYAELDSALGTTPSQVSPLSTAPSLVSGGATSTLVISAAVPPDPAFATPLPIPPVLAPTSSDPS